MAKDNRKKQKSAVQFVLRTFFGFRGFPLAIWIVTFKLGDSP
ncbi:hypothetical protein SGRA_3395 [Saprospira grandis str. Lewin]|uniref:Uncharacterized protein n=1 Tax=Saprospira grandis (strain Lewin) TaxID=984262 RepID=H6L184_SAPGL|nr:hypothetical protein SGRA_3395 [Saprospira grandis str. Lewin]